MQNMIQYLCISSCFLTHKMLYIRTLLSPRSRSTQEAQVSSLLSKSCVTGNGQLKMKSHQLLMQSLKTSLAPEKFIRSLLAKLQELQTADQLAKLLTLLHGTVCQMGYQGEVLEELSNLRMRKEFKMKGEGQSWFLPLYRAYMSYLAKLPSLSQIYQRASGDLLTISCETLLEDVFRLVNQLNLLRDTLSVTFNTIGRYYRSRMDLYRPMFRVLWKQIVMLYQYLRKAISRIFEGFQEIDTDRLKVFLDAIGEIQLMADKIEDFLMNKYFGKDRVHKRLYFKAQELAKLEYNIKQRHPHHKTTVVNHI